MANEIEDFEIPSVGQIEQDIMAGFEIINSSYKSKQSSTYFYLWDIGHDCVRKKYYSVLEPRSFSWKLTRRLAVGKGIHDQIQTALGKAGYLIEVPIKKYYSDFGFMLSAKIDAMTGTIKNPEKVVEIKSAAYFRYIKKPYRSNVCQLQQYLDMLDVDTGHFVYADTSSGDIKEFVIHRDVDIIISNLEKLEIVKDSIDNNILPPKFKNHLCKECPYKPECESDKTIIYESDEREHI